MGVEKKLMKLIEENKALNLAYHFMFFMLCISLGVERDCFFVELKNFIICTAVRRWSATIGKMDPPTNMHIAQ